MTGATPHIDIAGVSKRYMGLRPLRIRRLVVEGGDRIALAGFDQAAAEVFVNLVTGASVPDEGDVVVAGRNTRDISTDTEWLASLDRFGIVTERAVLLESLSVAANLALPMTLSIEPIADDVQARVDLLAAAVGLRRERLTAPVSALSPEERVRAHVARALAQGPQVLLLEHPTSRLEPEAAEAIGAMLRALSSARGLAWVALTEDDRFVRAAGGTRLRLQAATGELTPDGGFWQKIRTGLGARFSE